MLLAKATLFIPWTDYINGVKPALRPRYDAFGSNIRQCFAESRLIFTECRNLILRIDGVFDLAFGQPSIYYESFKPNL